jgi:predicted ABC-type transport system involved in lysophospholipase L1 biosynthesis ATPase subunit
VELLLGLCRSADTALILVTHNAAHAAKTRRSLLLTAGVLGKG